MAIHNFSTLKCFELSQKLFFGLPQETFWQKLTKNSQTNLINSASNMWLMPSTIYRAQRRVKNSRQKRKLMFRNKCHFVLKKLLSVSGFSKNELEVEYTLEVWSAFRETLQCQRQQCLHT